MILRFCICIPTYNNPETISAVVDDCLRLTPYPVLVVDDGSDKPVRLAVHDRVTTLRLETNQGKGIALQAGLKECLSRGFTHMISVDGDGQHLVTELAKLVDASIENPWDLIIGSRRLVSENVPSVSKFGRNFSNFWVQFQTSQQVSDSQSGFRIYPLFQTQNLKFWTRKFDFEIEILIRLLWRGVDVQDVDVECYYPSKEERVSHFHKFWDNLRISCLNTVLVVLSLVRTQCPPRGIAFAVGTGVWVGCTPFYGFHTLIVAGIALLFRMNAVYLWLGTQISIPPLAPFLMLASVAIGARITGLHTKSAMGFSGNWLLGSLIFGAALGILFGVIAYIAAKHVQNKNPRKSPWNGRTRGGRFGNWFLKTVTQVAGLEVAYGFLFFIIPYFYLFAPKGRKAANEYWKTIEPQSGWLVRQWRVLGHFYRFAQTLLDRVHQGFHDAPCFGIQANGMENILTPINAGEGLILMSAHVGSWDIAAAMLKSDGLKTQFHRVQYESDGVTFDKAAKTSDPEHVKKLISNQAQQPILKIRELLSRGLPVALMGDRPLGGQFELVSFFGKLAPVDCTSFRIASACGVPLLVTFGFKGQKGNYDFYATPPVRYAYTGRTHKSLEVLEWAQSFAEELEKHVRKYPNQWFNFYPFWSSLPTPPEGVEVSKGRNYSKEQLRIPKVERVQSGAVPTPIVERVLQSLAKREESSKDI